MYQPRKKGFIVKAVRLGDEPHYVQLTFESDTSVKEKHLEKEVKKPKNPFPNFNVDVFVEHMRKCNNVGDCKVDEVAVYMNNMPESLDNEYLSGKYFTTGLRLVATGERHVFRNFTFCTPIVIANCCNNLPDYERMVNTSKVLTNKAFVQNDFNIFLLGSGECMYLDEGSIYFLYTVSHSHFSITSEPMNSKLAIDASSVCEVQMQGLNSSFTLDTSPTPHGTAPGIAFTNPSCTVSEIAPSTSPASPVTSVSTQPEEYKFELETSRDINFELSVTTRKASK